MAETFRQQLVQRITRNLLDTQVLRLVRAQPMWGYKIKKQIETDSGVKIRHGALYPLLNKLEKNGFLASEKQEHGGRKRKVYTMTQKGKQYLDTYDSLLREQIQR